MSCARFDYSYRESGFHTLTRDAIAGEQLRTERPLPMERSGPHNYGHWGSVPLHGR
jgi:hypothetical protein